MTQGADLVTVCLLGFFLAGLGAAVIALNIWYSNHRRNMTPEQRRREDEEMRIPGDW
jgi:hypothetical protein